MEIAAEQVMQFEHYVRLVSCAPEHNRQRFYLFSWQRSLYGERVLVCTSFGLGRWDAHGVSAFLKVHRERAWNA